MKLDVKNEAMFFYATLMYYSSFFGSFLFAGTSIVILYLIGQTQASYKFLLGIAIAMLIEYSIKLFYKHKRPDFNKDREKALFEKFQERSSFPSGHSAAISLFTTLVARIYMNTPLTILFVGLTILVGLSRVFLKRHYVSDVIAGYIIGLMVGYFVY